MVGVERHGPGSPLATGEGWDVKEGERRGRGSGGTGPRGRGRDLMFTW